ncbi:cytochrome c [Methyloversatilis discipulorum]|uniref:c-type cytochrome n=1 Tax=Methyloversatilis discipulorum TaxID=1119528 RepID=UPI003137F94E
MKTTHLAVASFALLLAACDKPQDPPKPVTAPSAEAAAPAADTAAPALPSPPAAAPLPDAPGPGATPPTPADTMQNAPTTPNGKTPPDTTENARPIPSGQPAPAPASSAAPADGTAVAGGDIVKGWKTWRSAACERCHGPAQEGMVGPSLIESLKKLSKDEVRHAVIDGRLERGMPGHPYLADKFDDLYAYLKGRSDGSVPKVRPDGA